MMSQEMEPLIFSLSLKYFALANTALTWKVDDTQFCEDLADELQKCTYVCLHKIAPIVINTSTKLISSSIKMSSCQVISIKKSCAGLIIMNHTLRRYSVHEIDKLYETHKESIHNIYFYITMLFDASKAEDKFSIVEKEELAIACFDFMNTSLELLQHHLLHNRPKALSGPFLAQHVQSCLHFSRHTSKAIALGALSNLFNLTTSIDDPSVWRNFYPGVFSGLYGICHLGFKR